jgi:hypothetical protein
LTDGGSNKYWLSFTCRSYDIYSAMHPRHISVFCWIPNVRKSVKEGIRDSFNLQSFINWEIFVAGITSAPWRKRGDILNTTSLIRLSTVIIQWTLNTRIPKGNEKLYVFKTAGILPLFTFRNTHYDSSLSHKSNYRNVPYQFTCNRFHILLLLMDFHFSTPIFWLDICPKLRLPFFCRCVVDRFPSCPAI